MKKKKGARSLIIVLAVILFIAAVVLYFGFINNKTAIGIREFLAEKMLEKGDNDKAASLYYDILNRDDSHTDSYLALADIYLKSEDYKEAHDILDDGLECAGGEKLADKQWGIYEKEARKLETDSTPQEVMGFVKEIPAEELIAYYEDPSRAEKYSKEDAKRWSDAVVAVAKNRLRAGDARSAESLLEDAIENPLNEFVDVDVFYEAIIPVYLALGDRAYESDDIDGARYYYNKVLGLDPENKSALEGLAKLDVKDDKAQWEYICVNGKIKADLGINMHGLKLNVPVVMDLKMEYNGAAVGAESLNIDETVSISVIGNKNEESQSIRLYQSGNDIVMENRLIGRQKEENASLKDKMFEYIADYHALISTAKTDGKRQKVNGVDCDVSHSTMMGKNYLYYLPKDMLPAGTDAFMNSLSLDVTRYTAADDGRVVRVEAEMLSADADALNSLLMQFIGSFNADVSINSMTAVFDVECR